MRVMREIGVHIRVEGSLVQAVQKAIRYNVPIFQCFLVSHKSGRMLLPSDEEKEQFLSLRREHCTRLYVHGSYWINLASVEHGGHRALYREAHLAKKLGFTHIVLHPGSAKGAEHKSEGIKALAHVINRFLARESSLSLMLENTAHGGMSVGGDFQDFKELLALIDEPDRLSFCVDLAHAYSYGYNIVDTDQRNGFIQLLESTIGINKIALIHLNDTVEALGSRIDKHAVVGHGLIGQMPLKEFILDKRLCHIPVLMELPIMSEEQELAVITMVRQWHE